VNSTTTAHYEKITHDLAGSGYSIIDDFLSAAEVTSILQLDEFRDALLLFKRAGVGHEKQIRESIRGDFIRWIDPKAASTELRIYLGKLNELIGFLNQALFLSLKDYELHLTIYPAGSFYKRHMDQFQSGDHRRLSVICYLNKDWKEEHGGQLRLYLPEGSCDILPTAGRLVCFRSDQVEHEVLPASRDRLSLTGWILDQYAELKHL
jgi:SM-20-related protein